MVLGELLLDECTRVGRLSHRARRLQLVVAIALLDLVEIAGHELESRVIEGRPAVVGERDPPVESASASSRATVNTQSAF